MIRANGFRNDGCEPIIDDRTDDEIERDAAERARFNYEVERAKKNDYIRPDALWAEVERKRKESSGAAAQKKCESLSTVETPELVGSSC